MVLEPEDCDGEQHEEGGGDRDGRGVAAVLEAGADLLSAAEASALVTTALKKIRLVIYKIKVKYSIDIKKRFHQWGLRLFISSLDVEEATC